MEDTFLEIKNLEAIFQLIKGNQNVTVVTIPGAGRTRMGNILTSPEILTTYIGKKEMENRLFMFLDQMIGIENCKDQILLNLGSVIETTDLKKAIFFLSQNKYKLTLVIDNFEFKEEFYIFLNSLKNFLRYDLTIIALTLTAEYEKLDEEVETVNMYSSILQNVIEIPYLDKNTSEEWIKDRIKEIDVKISKQDIENLITFSGGAPRLMKNYLRAYKKYGNCEETENSKEIDLLIKTLFEQFSEKEKALLTGLVLENEVSETRLLSLMKEMNVVDNENHPIGKWISKVIKSANADKKLKIKNGLILLENVDITEQFTDAEVLLLDYLYHNKMITRDDFPKVVESKEYSDWAIDKFVSRIRKKFEEFGLNPNILVTIKKKGFKLEIAE